MNSVSLIGHLVADPEITYLPSGTAVANFRIAVADVFGSGEDRTEKTYWFNCKAYGKLAETISEHLGKGSKVGIQGKLTQESWENENGKKSIVRIIVNRIDFLSWKSAENEDNQKNEPF